MNIPSGYYPVDDNEFNSFGYVAEVYRRVPEVHGGNPIEMPDDIMIIQHSHPPKKTVHGEVITTNLLYNPVTQEDRERVRVARMILSGYKGSFPDINLLNGVALSPPPHITVIEGSDARGILINNIEIISNIFENMVTIDDIEDVEDVSEYINLFFVGCPTISMAFDRFGLLYVEEQPRMFEALSVLFGKPIYLTH